MPAEDRPRLGIVFGKTRFGQWLYSPDPTALRWIPLGRDDKEAYRRVSRR